MTALPMTAAAKLTRRAGGLLLDTLLPPHCLRCDAMVDGQGNLCAACWREIDFLGPPQCGLCGFPFAHDEGAEAICAACSRRTPDFDRARAVFAYSDGSRQLLLRLKHADRLDGVPAFAHWLARAGDGLLAEGAVLAPVPLHRWRLARRRYNQAALLTRSLSRLTGLAHRPDLLRRVRATASQGGLSPGRRARNVAGAFAVRPKDGGWLAGRQVVLIDDVFTTGATVSACARTLKRAGAAGVDV
ncbi:MAG: ComF family protein, partial [Alphaproteobacteria bacterium]|nr:ComF family protein [Alphaproteobacteria bacterium]